MDLGSGWRRKKAESGVTLVFGAEAVGEESVDLFGGDLAGGVVAALIEGVVAVGVLDPDGAGTGRYIDAADVVVVDIVHADGEAVVEQRVEPVDEAVCVRWFDERVVVVETDRFAVVGNTDQQCPAVVVEHSCDSLRHDLFHRTVLALLSRVPAGVSA